MLFDCSTAINLFLFKLFLHTTELNCTVRFDPFWGGFGSIFDIFIPFCGLKIIIKGSGTLNVRSLNILFISFFLLIASRIDYHYKWLINTCITVDRQYSVQIRLAHWRNAWVQQKKKNLKFEMNKMKRNVCLHLSKAGNKKEFWCPKSIVRSVYECV